MNMIVIFILMGILFLSILVVFKFLNTKINMIGEYVENMATTVPVPAPVARPEPKIAPAEKKVRFSPNVEIVHIKHDIIDDDDAMLEEGSESTEEIEEIEEYDEDELDDILSDDLNNIE